jgi:hypothetical protein
MQSRAHASLLHIPVDCGAEEHQVGPHHLLDNWQWDCSGLVHHKQLCLAKLAIMLRLNVLDGLQQVVENEMPAMAGITRHGLRTDRMLWMCRWLDSNNALLLD